MGVFAILTLRLSILAFRVGIGVLVAVVWFSWRFFPAMREAWRRGLARGRAGRF